MTTDSETRRQEILRRYRILDSPPEETFDRIATLVARVFDVPFAAITLVDGKRLFLKATHGFPRFAAPRQSGFCGEVIDSDSIVFVKDAASEPASRTFT